jgi:hypothetical protein
MGDGLINLSQAGQDVAKVIVQRSIRGQGSFPSAIRSCSTATSGQPSCSASLPKCAKRFAQFGGSLAVLHLGVFALTARLQPPDGSGKKRAGSGDPAL